MSGTLAHETYHLMNDWEGASQMEEYIAYSVGYAASNKIISEAANPIVENFFRQAGWE